MNKKAELQSHLGASVPIGECILVIHQREARMAIRPAIGLDPS